MVSDAVTDRKILIFHFCSIKYIPACICKVYTSNFVILLIYTMQFLPEYLVYGLFIIDCIYMRTTGHNIVVVATTFRSFWTPTFISCLIICLSYKFSFIFTQLLFTALIWTVRIHSVRWPNITFNKLKKVQVAFLILLKILTSKYSSDSWLFCIWYWRVFQRETVQSVNQIKLLNFS